VEAAAERRESIRRRVDVEARRTGRNGTSTWTTVGVIHEDHSESHSSVSGLAGSAGLSWAAKSALSLYSEANWNQELTAVSAISVRNVAFNTGVTWTMPRGYALSASARYSKDSSTLSLSGSLSADAAATSSLEAYLRDRSLNSYQFTARIQKKLTWGRRPRAADAGNTGVRPRDFGSIEGFVFNDLNSDRMKDEGEPGIAGLSIKLDGRFITAVDATGHFAFGEVPVGLHTVELDLTTVRATYDVGQRWRAAIDVGRRTTTHVEFALVQLGKLAGRVLVAQAAPPEAGSDASAQSGPVPANNVMVALNNGQKVTMTDADGEFEFTSLPAGPYRIRVERVSLPSEWTALSNEGQLVNLESGGVARDLELIVEIKPRPSRRILVDQPDVSEARPVSPQDVPSEREQSIKASAPRRQSAARRQAASRPASLRTPRKKPGSVRSSTGASRRRTSVIVQRRQTRRPAQPDTALVKSSAKRPPPIARPKRSN
jgi:hypothetical protein